ncbi:hypothetical protein [Cylindrospermum sp. FACHB-282]|uniref:hypothetical protein n=1 Tax=Cylindrospermum sp. FACHB-282 TaxID=2692794 RepID=UPI0016833CBC|nr:hypothetical protein [Cylindrospermum sp. FACHB-282]MBD2388824.1 hypothetical protein [Cylindrospermum sp. FACHB-282]
MILTPDCGPRKMLAPDFSNIPAELKALNTWACWRARTSNRKDGQRVVYQRVHPFTGAEPRGNRPEQWAAFEDALHPRLRKPTDGIGVFLAQDSGLAVVFNAPPDLRNRLGDRVVYAECALQGDGLTLIVRAGVLGAVAGRFLPLSGQPPYQGGQEVTTGVRLDAVWTPSGHEPCQEKALSGQVPYQENAPCLDTGRTLVSWSPKEIMAGGGGRTVGEQLIRVPPQ